MTKFICLFGGEAVEKPDIARTLGVWKFQGWNMLLLQQLQPSQLTPCPVPRSRPGPSCSRRISTNLGLNFNPGFVFFCSIAFSSRSILFNYSILSRISTQKELNWIRLLPPYLNSNFAPTNPGFSQLSFELPANLDRWYFSTALIPGKNNGLVPIVAEIYGQYKQKYYAVAVVKKNNTGFGLEQLKGKKSCHTGARKTAGWNVPIGYMLRKNIIPPVKCDTETHDFYSVANFFNQSCVPGKV